MDSALVVLDKWSSYGGGRLNRFDFRKNTWKNIEKICSKLKSELLILGKYIFRNKIKKPLFKTFFFFFFFQTNVRCVKNTSNLVMLKWKKSSFILPKVQSV